jgi:outer membrane protein
MNMQLHSRLFLGIALLALSCHAGAANLVDVFQQAVRNDPQIREAQATRMATQESTPQARAALLPQLSATGSWQQRDSNGSRTISGSDVGTNTVSVVDSNMNTDGTQYDIRLTQSVFHWDQWAALKQAEKVSLRADFDYRAAEQDLVARVSTRYFDVLAAQDTLEASQATLEAVSRQLEQAEKRFEVGLTAVTDVREARAARDQATADVIANKRTLATRQEFLRELTGDSYDVLAAPNEDLPLKAPEPANADRWVSKALEQNPVLASARLAADISRRDIEIARGAGYPSLDLVVGRSSSILNGTNDSTIRGVTGTAPADSDSTSDFVSLQITVPLFAGGGNSSRVRERVYMHRASRERLERTLRETERATRDAYLGVISEMSRVEALKQALESSRTALQATEAGFEVGTRTTVDVLEGRRRVFEAQTNYSRSRYDYILNVIQLKQSAGSLSSEDITMINGWLK